MSEEKKKGPPPAPSRHEGRYIIIQVPPKTSKDVIEKQIRDALNEQPQDIFAASVSREVIIVVQEEGPFNGDDGF
jgi:hypothetical protein